MCICLQLGYFDPIIYTILFISLVEAKLHSESKVIQRCFDDNNDDEKGDDKEQLKDQSRTIQEFKIRIKKNSRFKKKVQRQESRFKVQDLKNQDQDS